MRLSLEKQVIFGKKILAVVPARSGSKSIPGKNLLKWRGISLIGHAAKFCKECSFIDQAVISTDSENYGREGEKYGLKFLFLRPKSLSRDKTSSEATWRHAWEETEKILKTQFDYSILLEPTSPERCINEIKNLIKNVINNKYDAGLTLTKVDPKYSAFKQFKLQNRNFRLVLKNKRKIFYRRQDLPKTYIRNGACYVFSKAAIFKNKYLVNSLRIAGFVTKEKANIDDYNDFKKLVKK